MTLALFVSTDRADFEARPRYARVYGGFVAAWLWFEVRFSR